MKFLRLKVFVKTVSNPFTILNQTCARSSAG
jgi:hypothetical protein